MESNPRYKTLLIILDGWGHGDHTNSDAITQANTPFYDKLLAEYPSAQLLTSGKNVGLPIGQMGNSEVGHLNIGAGRVIFQDLEKINQAIENNSIMENKTIIRAFQTAKDRNKTVHLLGLVSDGGVHSMNTHLYKLIDIAEAMGLKKVCIHAITDGRDTDPKSGLGYIRELQHHLAGKAPKIATLTGRYYTMDRDKRWERIQRAYDVMVNSKGKYSEDLLKTMEEDYANGITDEFIEPIVVREGGQAVGRIEEGDTVFCFNFRTDRLRQITTVLTQENMPEYHMHSLDLAYYTLTNYDKRFKNVQVVYDKEDVSQTLGETISAAGLTQLRIAETEKYAHVTYFLSGGREQPFPNENRILVNSPRVATYDLQPEMSAFLVKDKLVEQLNQQTNDFICVNFANGDMVGHTGVYAAILKAAEAVDLCLTEVVDAALINGYEVLLTADHGNADYAVNEDGTPNTAHSLNPVPLIYISTTHKHAHVDNGILADLAPTILHLMGLEIPPVMTGKVLIS